MNLKKRNKLKRVYGISMALVTFITSTATTTDCLAGVDADNNAKKNLSQMTMEEKRQILLKLGFIDETIAVLTDNEIDEYCGKYLDGFEVAVQTTSTLLDEEGVLEEAFSATLDDYLKTVDYSLPENEVEAQVKAVKEEYFQVKEMYNDFVNDSENELVEKYDFDKKKIKAVKSISAKVKKNKDETSKKIKGKKTRGCANSSSISVSLVSSWDGNFSKYGRKVDLVFNKKSWYTPDNKYRDISAIGWNKLLTVDAITYRDDYGVQYYSIDLTEEQIRGCFDDVYSGNIDSKGVAGVVRPRTDRTLDGGDFFENVEAAKMAVWSNKQSYSKRYKGNTVTFTPKTGVHTVYLSPKKQGDTCKIYGEYIHKTSALQHWYDGDIGDEYYENFFESDNGLANDLLTGGVVSSIALNTLAAANVAGKLAFLGTPAAFVGIGQFLISNCVKSENYIGPAATTSITCSFTAK